MAYVDLLKLFHKNKEEYKTEYEKRINSNDCIMLGYEIKGYPAFYIDGKDVNELMYSILRMDKAVAEYSRMLPRLAFKQFAEESLIDEIVLTNQIEGVRSTRKDVLDVLNILQAQSEEKKKEYSFLGLIKRYTKLLDGKNVSLKTCQDIRDLYDEIVLKEVVADDSLNMPDGMIFRRESVDIVKPTGKKSHIGKYPEKEIVSYMDKALRFLNDESFEPLYRACLFHYMIEDIHPFYDGNGRLGRFILGYSLSGYLEPIIAYRISKTICENKKVYYKAFEICDDERNKGDLTPFLMMMLGMIEDAYTDLIDFFAISISKMKKYQESACRLDGTTDKVVKELYSLLIQASLFSENGVTIEELLSELGITRMTLLKKLEIVSNQNLLVVKKEGKKKCLSIDLDELDRIG